jgi:integrase/recombinase XerD
MTFARDMLEREDLRTLLAACDQSPSGIRDRALITLLASTGVRISEALDMHPHDLDLAGHRLHVRRGKGGKPRHVWVHPDASAPVRRWISERNRLALQGPLFCSLNGRRLSQSYVRSMLPRLAKRGGIAKRVHSDGLRHCFAAWAFRCNVTVRSLQLQFGHENIASTLDYLERMGLHSGFSELDRALT